MTVSDHNQSDCNEPVRISPDPYRLSRYHRQQLSAMLDGELAPDEARFMLRRLQHDVELASCWERWQVCGDVLRGHADDLLPADFAQRVARAIQTTDDTHTAQASSRRHRMHHLWRRGGVAMVASVALAAWIGMRNPAWMPELVRDGVNALVVPVTIPSAEPATTEFPSRASTHVIAVSEPSRTQPDTVRSLPPPVLAVTEATPADTGIPAARALLTRAPPLPPRSWPRSLLPGARIGELRTVVGYVPSSDGARGFSSPLELDAFRPRGLAAPHAALGRDFSPSAPMSGDSGATQELR